MNNLPSLDYGSSRKQLSVQTWTACTLLAASALCSFGCDPDREGDDSATLEMFSWWVAPGEKEALDALLAVHSEAHPNVEIINAAASSSGDARDRLVRRFAQGFPPDTFQANGGHDLLKWVSTDGSTDGQSKIEALDWFYADRGLNTVIPQAVIDAVSFNGKPYAIPLNIHRTNSLFYNTAVLEANGVGVPATFEEFLTTCETIQAAGTTCIAIGAESTWPLNLLVWENLMLASAGVEYQERFFAGQQSAEDPEVAKLVDDLLAMWAYVDPGAFQTEWTEAVAKVGTGEAAFTVMGDWAKGMLSLQGMTPGVEFGQAPFPGTAGIFVFGTDTFPLAKGAPQRDAAIDLLDVIASADGQIAFNIVKGSIPSRVDVPTDAFDILGQQTAADFRSATSLMMANPAPAEFAVEAAIAEALRSGDPTVLRNGIRTYYDVL